MAKLLKIAKTKDVPPGQAAAFTIEGQKIALFNVEGTYHAIGDTCTHRGGPLSEGDVQRHQGHLSVARCGFRPENRCRMVIQKENALLKIERVTGDKAIEEAHL